MTHPLRTTDELAAIGDGSGEMLPPFAPVEREAPGLDMASIEIEPGKRYLITVRTANMLTVQEYLAVNIALKEAKAAIEDEDQRVVFLIHGPNVDGIDVVPLEAVDGPAS